MTYLMTYDWKIVPTNVQGDEPGCQVWTFTTGPDPTIILFPSCESYDGTFFPPYGWSTAQDCGNRYAGHLGSPDCRHQSHLFTAFGFGMTRYNSDIIWPEHRGSW